VQAVGALIVIGLFVNTLAQLSQTQEQARLQAHLAYKDIDAVIAAQSELIEVAHTLRQVVCVKG
jgi:hypothetical protein